MALTIRDVEDAVRAHFNIKRDDFISNLCRRSIARPRQIAMFLARKYTNASYPAIGRHFCRDHSTVYHAEERIAAMMQTHEYIKTHVEQISEKLEASEGWRKISVAYLSDPNVIQPISRQVEAA